LMDEVIDHLSQASFHLKEARSYSITLYSIGLPDIADEIKWIAEKWRIDELIDRLESVKTRIKKIFEPSFPS